MLRVKAWRLVSYIRDNLDSLRFSPVKNVLSIDDIDIKYIPRKIRLIDGIRITYQDHDVWLPLFQRIRLRRIVRKFVLDNALFNFEEV